MLNKRIPQTVLLTLAILVLGTLLPGQKPLPAEAEAGSSPSAAHGGIDPQAVALPPPPPRDEDMFPCSDCHELGDEPDTRPRQLEMAHEEIILEHNQESGWCMSCHDADNRDMLHSASGELIEFSQAYKLCGQCHGSKYRDWKAGAHGKRSGSWSGEKNYLLCAHCHDPHSPSFKPLEPLAAPTPPGEIR